MGESVSTPVRLQFDRRLRLDSRGAAITSDAGLLACRELDAALGLTETANDYIHESRTGCCPFSDIEVVSKATVGGVESHRTQFGVSRVGTNSLGWGISCKVLTTFEPSL